MSGHLEVSNLGSPGGNHIGVGEEDYGTLTDLTAWAILHPLFHTILSFGKTELDYSI